MSTSTIQDAFSLMASNQRNKLPVGAGRTCPLHTWFHGLCLWGAAEHSL